MRSRPILRVLAVIFALLTAFFVASMIFLGPAEQYTDVSRAYTYTADTPDALPVDAPTEIEEDGKTYTLVQPEEGATPEITILEQDTKRTETVTITGLTSQQAPETKVFNIGGTDYTLVLESADYTPTEKSYHATGELNYTQATQPDAPQTTDVTYVNEAGETVTVPGELTTIEQTGTGAPQRKYFYATIRLPEGANAFMVNGSKLVTYDPNTPCWEGYQTDVLVGLGLSGNVYRVVGGQWDGEPYVVDGEVRRDIVWTLETKTSSTWVAHYEANGTTTTYTAVAVYSGDVAALGIPEEYINQANYTLSTNLTYRLNEVVSNNPVVKLMASNALLFPVLAGVSGLLFLVCLFALLFLARTPKDRLVHAEILEGDYSPVTDAPYEGEYPVEQDEDFSTKL